MEKLCAINDFDREIWAEELDDFVPGKVFDAHCHLWDNRFAGNSSNPPLHPDVDYRSMHEVSSAIFPGRELGFLLLPFPLPEAGTDAVNFNTFMGEQTALSPLHLGSALTTPDMTPEYLAETVRKYGFCGLKPYLAFTADPGNCRIADYFPEKLMEFADAENLAVTLHLSRFTGVADPCNTDDLAKYAARYPRIRWILAHCARGFNSFMLEKAIGVLKTIPNLWFDTSAICDVYSHYLILKNIPADRIFFGTDNTACGAVHGNYITWGRGWQYFVPAEELKHCRADATLVVYEQLRAQKHAAVMAGLDAVAIENIFWNNAEKFFNFNK